MTLETTDDIFPLKKTLFQASRRKNFVFVKLCNMTKEDNKNQKTETKESKDSTSGKMIAVIQTGGKQYLVSEGKSVRVEKLEGEEGKEVEFKDLLNGKNVVAKISGGGKSKKVRGRVFINKVRRSRFPRGHRQQYTVLTVVSIA